MLLAIEAGLGLLDHLGMTGKFVRQKPGDPPVPSSRVRFFREDGTVVHYRNPRMFGRVAAGPASELEEDETFRSLGPDTWDSPPKPSFLFEELHRLKRPIRTR